MYKVFLQHCYKYKAFKANTKINLINQLINYKINPLKNHV